MFTLADELVLLAVTAKGDVASGAALRLDQGIVGAQLMELALAGRVAQGDDGVLVVADDTPTGDAPTDALLAALAAAGSPRTAQTWIQERASAGARAPVLAGLQERGVLSEEQGRVLGVFKRTRHLEADPAPEREVRARLCAAVLEPDGPVDPRTAALASLVVATELTSELFADDAERARAQPRLAELARGDALRGALGVANDALVAALMASVATAVSASVASTAAVVIVTTS